MKIADIKSFQSKKQVVRVIFKVLNGKKEFAQIPFFHRFRFFFKIKMKKGQIKVSQ